jgi:hypothetical protein
VSRSPQFHWDLTLIEREVLAIPCWEIKRCSRLRRRFLSFRSRPARTNQRECEAAITKPFTITRKYSADSTKRVRPESQKSCGAKREVSPRELPEGSEQPLSRAQRLAWS